VQVPLRDYVHDLGEMLAAITDRTRLIFVCNPNNPTGTAVGREELVRFLRAVPDNVVVALDEAYREFVRDPDVPDGLSLLAEHPNVVLLRTFSKAYGLASLRIGYAVVPPALTPIARLVGAVFFPGALGQAAALACLSEEVAGEVRQRCAELAGTRTALTESLRGLGFTVPDSQANFLWLPLADRAAAFAEQARQAGIRVMALPGAGVRITIGTAEANQRLLAFAAGFAASAEQ
jgi:histidinol-phosphate aminotransferase